MKRLLYWLVAAILLSACGPSVTSATSTPPALTQTAAPSNQAATLIRTPVVQPGAWWNQVVFYEIFVRSFYDSNGDGIGDFNGITQKLYYLNDGNPATTTDLGINAIWLMPVHPSPTYHGYDVADYYGVNPDYGTMDDFKHLVNEAHKRGIKVILDLVLNHTSSQNPWFIQSNNDPQSPYRNWYIWSETDPGYAGPFGVAWHPGKYGFYYGMFDTSMPDLNYRNPAVTAEMEKVVHFWLKDVGVDGFRIDAAKHLIEEGQKQENTQSTHDWFKGFYTFYKSENPDAFTVGEVAASTSRLISTYTGNQMDMVFNFELASGIMNSAKGESNSGINSAIKFAQQDMPSWQFGTFLTNHDQNRVLSVLAGNLGKARVAASLLLTLPGTPFIYYGEEIGMEGQKPDEDIRRPMQWSGAIHGGFTIGSPWREVGANFAAFNVAAQLADPNSLLSHYKQLIALRQSHPALQSGSLTLLTAGSPGVYAGLRLGENENFLVVINLTKSAITEYNLTLDQPILNDGTYQLIAQFGSVQSSKLTVTGGLFSSFKPLAELAPFSSYIFQIKS